MSKNNYSIGDTSRMTGASRKQLRNWEAKGYIPTKVDRIVYGNRAFRRFTLKQVELISRIKDFLDEGYTLSAAAKKAAGGNIKSKEDSNNA